MNLYLLKAREDLPREDNPWNPWYDKNFSLVVRAENETAARELAHAEGADENRGTFMGRKVADTEGPWLLDKYSTCDVLPVDGAAEVVIVDHYAA